MTCSTGDLLHQPPSIQSRFIPLAPLHLVLFHSTSPPPFILVSFFDNIFNIFSRSHHSLVFNRVAVHSNACPWLGGHTRQVFSTVLQHHQVQTHLISFLFLLFIFQFSWRSRWCFITDLSPFPVLKEESQEEAGLGKDTASLVRHLTTSLLPVPLQQVQQGLHRALHAVHGLCGLMVLEV